MKKLYLKTLIVVFLITNFIPCKAQQILPLNTFIDDIPANAHVSSIILGYKANDRMTLPGQCPRNPDMTIHLSEIENPLIFTKQ